jgi:filamentous hemagglutinin family protein
MVARRSSSARRHSIRLPSPAASHRLTVLASLLATVCAPALAAPVGGNVVAGSAQINTVGGLTVINQNSASTVINWDGFNIGAAEIVRFMQPSSTSAALNRVVGGDASQILGRLEGNGRIFLVNPNGILFAPSSQVNVGGLVASAMNISDADLMASRLRFSGDSKAAVVNQGTIRTADGGFAVLAAQTVRNEGAILTPGGTTALVGAHGLTLDLAGNGLLRIAVDHDALNAEVANSGSISASGGQVLLSAHAQDALLRQVINQSGIIEADSVGSRNGVITLDGGQSGVVAVTGSISAGGRTEGSTGGHIDITGDKVGVFKGAVLDASGAAGGGAIRVGGGLQGQEADLHNANAVIVEGGAALLANAVSSGNGGRVIVWSDQATRVHGSIDASAPASGGDGGFVETSGHWLDVQGASVRAGAGRGAAGTWLLDPTTVTIYDPSVPGAVQSPFEETQPGVTGSGAAAAYVWTPGAGNSYIPVAAINQQLNSGTNVKVTTDDPANVNGSDAGDIYVNASISKTNGGDATLSLLAAGSIYVGAQGGAALTSTSGKLNVVLDAFKDGVSAVTTEGKVQILSGSRIATNGGFIAIGGGALGSDGKPLGFAVGDQAGVALQGVVLDTRVGAAGTGGGAISIAGAKRLWTTPDFGAGNGGVEILADFTAPASISTGGGALSIRGDYTGPAIPDVNSPYYAQYRNFVNTGDVTNLGTAAVYLDVPVNLGSGALTVASNGGAANAGTFFGLSGSILQAGSASFNVSGTQADLVLSPQIALTGALGIAMSGGGQTTQKSTIAAASLNLAAAGSDIVLPNDNQFQSAGGVASNLQLKIVNPANATTTINQLNLSGNLLLATNGAIVGSGASSALGSASSISAGDALGTRYDVDFATAGTFDFAKLALVARNVSIAALQHLQFKNLDASGSASFAVADGGFVVDYAGVADNFRVGQNLSINTHGVNGSITVNKSVTAQGSQVTLLADSDITLADGVVLHAGSAGTPASVTATAFQAGSTAASGALALNGNATILNHGGSVDLSGTGAGAAGIRIDGAGAIGSSTEAAGTITLHADASGGADALVLDGALYANGAVGFAGRRAGETMGVAGGAGTFNISRAELAHIVPGSAGIGALAFSSDGTVTVGNAALSQDALSLSMPQVAFTSAHGDVRFDAALSFSGAGASGAILTASAANGTVSQAASASLSADTLVLGGGVVSLGNTSNQINHFSTSGAFTSLTLGNSRQIVITDALNVAGNASFDASGNTLTLSSGANQFGGAVSPRGGATTINSATGLTLGAVDADTLAASAGALQFTGLTTVRGNLLASASAGNLGGNGALSVGGDASFAAPAGAIALNNTANVFRGLANLAASGDSSLRSSADLRLGAVQTHDLDVQSEGAIAFVNGASIGGALTANSLHGTVTQAGALNVAGASAVSANQGITLTNGANSFGGAFSFNTVANDVAIAATGPVRLGAGAAAGAINLDLTGVAQFTGAITAGGDVTVRALGADVASQGGTIHAGGSGVFRAIQANAGESMGLAGGAGTFQLTTADLNAITAFASYEFGAVPGGKLTFGTSTSGAVFAAPVTLRSGAAGIRIDGPLTTLGNNLLTLGANAGGAVTQSATGAVVASRLLLDGSGNYMLDGANQIGSIGSTGPAASVSLNNNGALTLGFGATPLTVTGNASLVLTGPLTQALALRVGGATSIDAGANAVTLTDSANAFAGAVSVTAGATSLRGSGPLSATLHTGATTLVADGDLLVGGSASGLDTRSGGETRFNTTTVNGNLHSVSGGAISQGGAVAVTGVADIGAGINTITLSNSANAFNGPLLLKGGVTSVANGTNLNAILQTGSANLSAAGALSVSGSAAGLFTQAGATNFGATNVAGILSVRATGDVSQHGALTVGGVSAIDAGSHAIVLTDAANSFGGTLALNAASAQATASGQLTAALNTGAATLTATDALFVSGESGNLTTNAGATHFGVTHVAGDLSVHAAGAVGQSGALTVTGVSTIDSGANAIVLGDSANSFGGVVSLHGGATSVAANGALTAVLATAATDLRASAPLAVSGSSAALDVAGSTVDFGATSVGGNLAARATGALGQSGALTVTGASSIDAGTITLTNAANNFGGPVTLTGGATSVRNNGALTAVLHTGATALQSAGALSLSGNATSLQASAGGAVSQTAPLAVTGASAIDASANAITLTEAANAFGGAVTLTGGAASVRNNGALTAVLHTGATNLQSAGTLSLSGNATSLQALAGGAVSQTAALAVTGASAIDAGANSITLDNGANALTGTVTLHGGATSVSNAGDLTAVLTTGATRLGATGNLAASGSTGSLATSAGATVFGATAVGGTLDVRAGGAVSQNGALSVTGNGSIDSGANAITLTNPGNRFGGALSLSGATTAVNATGPLSATLHTGATSLVADGDLLVDGSASGLDTRSGGETRFNTTTVNGNLHSVSGGAISQGGAVAVTGVADIGAGINTITLSNSANAFNGPLLLKGGVTSVANGTNLNAILQTGSANLSAAGALSVSGSAAGLFTQAGATNFGATNVAGILSVRATGDVSQHGALTVGGVSAIDAGSHAIVLTDAANSFGGTLALNAASAQATASGQLTAALNTGAATLTATDALFVSGESGNLTTNAGATHFGVTHVAGDLSVHAAGAVGQSGALTVTGVSTIDSGANAIVLGDSANSFGGVVSLHGGTTSVAANGALTALLGTAATDLRASGPLAVSGSSAALNVVGSTVDFGATSVGGNLAARATGALGQSGALTVTGASSIEAGTITLTNAANNFGGPVTLTGGVTSVRNNGALTAVLHTGATDLQSAGALSLSGSATSLQVLAGGAVTQSAPLAVTGASAIDAGANAINLTEAANAFGGAVTLTGGAASVRNNGALTAVLHTGATNLQSAGTLSLSGNATSLQALAGGAVSQTAALAVTGVSAIDAGANAITLTNGANALAGTVTLKGGATALTNNADLTVVLATGATTLDTGTHRLSVSGATSGALATRGGDTVFGATTVGASVDITAAGAVAFNGAFTVARDLTVRSATIGNGANGSVASTGAGTLTLAPANAASAVTVGGTAAAGYVVTSDMMTRFGNGFAAVTIGRDDLAGALTVAAGGAAFNASATLLSGAGGIALAGPVKVGADAALSLLSSGAIADQAGAGVSAHNLILGGGGAVNLTAATHQVDSLRTSDTLASLNFVDDRALTLGVEGGAGVGASGALSVQSRGALRVAAPVTGSVTRLVANANGADLGNLVIGAGGSVTATASGSALVLATTAGELVNGAGATAVQAPNGRWVIYLGSPTGSTENGLAGRADPAVPRLYDTAYSSAAISQPGNHLVYRFKPTLAVTADDQSRVYGAADIAPTYKVTGLVSDDGVTDTLAGALGGTPQLSILTGTAAVAGTSPIAFVQKPVSPIGYATSFTNGTLTVSKALLTVSADSASRLIAQANPPLTYGISGFQYGQNESVFTSPVQVSTLATLESPVGQYAITPGAAAAANYSLRYVPGVLTVTDPAAAAIGAILNQSMTDCVFLHRCDGPAEPFRSVPRNLQIDGPDGPVLQGSAAPAAQKVAQR